MLLSAFVSNATPSISGFSPNYSSSSDPNNITISGSGFLGGPLVVKFNGVNASAAAATFDNTIIAHVANGTPRGTGPVFVSVSGQQALTNNGIYFTVIGPNDPYVTDFSPTAGSPGIAVTINGTHFIGTTGVKFNGANASFSPITSDLFITATVPANATTGPISVEKTGIFTNTTSVNFFVSPVITNFSPGFGRAGTNVVIRGSSFSNAFAVKFNNISALTFNVDSNSQITAVVPNNPTTGPIRVEAPGGTNITSSSFLVQPTIFSFTPGFGAAGTNVTVTGANFNVGTPAVKFGGVTAATPTGVTFSQLLVVVPAGATNAPITVTTSDGSGTSAQIFYVPPRITSFTPTNSAPGTTVRLSGTNFTGATAVSFNGQPAASFVVTNNNNIGAVVPSGVITGPISVATPAGTTNGAGLFYGAPVITSFNPTHGAPGTNVTILGTNLLGATAVLFNAISASFTVNNNGAIAAVVPAGAQTGPLTVVAPGGTRTSATSFTIDVASSDLNISLVDSPDPVFVGSNLVYTLTVTNNGPSAALTVTLSDALPASVNLKSASTSQGTLNTNGNPIIGNLGTLNNSGVATVTLTVVPQTIGPITNVVSVGNNNFDPNTSDNSATETTLVLPFPFLSIQNFSASQVKVFWPAPLSNFTLLFKNNLMYSVSWNTDITARVISGTNISVTEPSSGAPKFFRLKQ